MEKSVNSYSPLTLAYVGDAVIELLAREFLVKKEEAQLSVLNERCRAFVTAVNQSAAAKNGEEIFTEEEADIFRRGRNAKTSNTPKSAKVREYHRATGLEAVFGYLYLSGNTERARELFCRIYGVSE